MGLFKKKAPQEPVMPVNEVHDDSTGTAADVEAVMKKYDRESNTRVWEGAPKIAISILMAAFSRAYVDETAARTDPQASPILADDAALRALPPVLTVAAECDLLAGLSRRFHGRLAALGREGDARVVVPGSLHGFLSFPRLPDAQAQALAATRAWLEARLR